MPLYEYHCSSCGKDFEQIVSFSQADLAPACPFCDHEDTHKKISRVASFGASESGISFSSGSSCGTNAGFT